MIDKDLLLRRRKDGVEIITLQKEDATPRHSRYNAAMRPFVPVRYVKTGRKGYLRAHVIESDYVVVGINADPDKRWERSGPMAGESAAALEQLRERDISLVRKRILNSVVVPGRDGTPSLGDLNPTPNAVAALDQAIHMILSGS